MSAAVDCFPRPELGDVDAERWAIIHENDPDPVDDEPAPSAPVVFKPADLGLLCARMPGRYSKIATGIPGLDEATRGGLRTANLAIIGGAPGGHKTSFAASLAYLWARDGVPTIGATRAPVFVSVVACDESGDGYLSRWGQIERVDRDRLDSEDLSVSRPAWAVVAQRLLQVKPRLALWDPREDGITVEGAAAELAARPGDVARRVLIVDSAQSATGWTCDDPRDLPRTRIDRRVATSMRLARELRFSVVLLSELSRTGYRTPGGDPMVDPMSTLKESGGLEYGADQLFIMSRCPSEGAPRIDVNVAKTRWGSSGVSVRLRRDGWLSYAEEKIPSESEQAAEDTETDVAEVVDALARNAGPVGSIDAVVALAGGMRAKRGRNAVRLAISQGLIVVGGTARERTYDVPTRDAKGAP